MVWGYLPELLDFRYEISRSMGRLNVIEIVFSCHLHNVRKVTVLFENAIEIIKRRLHPASVVGEALFRATIYLSSIDAIKKTIAFAINRLKLCCDRAIDFIYRSKPLFFLISSVTRKGRNNLLG